MHSGLPRIFVSCQDRANAHLLRCWVGVVALAGVMRGWDGDVEGMVALLLALRLPLSN